MARAGAGAGAKGGGGAFFHIDHIDLSLMDLYDLKSPPLHIGSTQHLHIGKQKSSLQNEVTDPKQILQQKLLLQY